MTDALAVIAAITLMFSVIWIAGILGGASVPEQIACPEKNTAVSATFARRLTWFWAPGARTDVLACSAFAEPSRVTCAKACLKHAAAGGQAPAPHVS